MSAPIMWVVLDGGRRFQWQLIGSAPHSPRDEFVKERFKLRSEQRQRAARIRVLRGFINEPPVVMMVFKPRGVEYALEDEVIPVQLLRR